MFSHHEGQIFIVSAKLKKTLDGHQLLSAAWNGLKTPRNRNLMAGPHRLVPSPTEDYSRISASFQRFQLSVLFFCEVALTSPCAAVPAL